MKKVKSPYTDTYYKSLDCIAQGALTNSKRPECFVLGKYPTHFIKGRGALSKDVRNIDYIDYVCSLGANLFGHNNEYINKAVIRQLNNGTIFSLGTALEVEAAERLKGLFPFIDRVKFLKTGSEACSAAVRIARAHTGRNKILVEGYHGWSDMFIDNDFSYGVDRNSTIDTFRGINQKIYHLRDESVAAVVIEPVELDNSPKRMAWLNDLRTQCDATGTLLIFDEIITGFRYPKMSVSVKHGITPDLICLGKAMAGGLPLAAVGGKKEIMEGSDYFVSSTFAGDCLALASFIEVCNMFQDVKYNINDLWREGENFLETFNDLWPEKITIKGYPTRGSFEGDKETLSLFWQECAKGGILFGPSWFYNFPLVEYNEMTLDICKDVINNIKAGRVKLEGRPPVGPFSNKQRK